jgi:hypothetical protein
MKIPDEIQETISRVKKYLTLSYPPTVAINIPADKDRVIFALYVEMLETLATCHAFRHKEIDALYVTKMVNVLEHEDK